MLKKIKFKINIKAVQNVEKVDNQTKIVPCTVLYIARGGK